MLWIYCKRLWFLGQPDFEVDIIKVNWIPERMYLTKLKDDKEEKTIEFEIFNKYFWEEKRKRFLEVIEDEINDKDFILEIQLLLFNF